MTGFTQLCCLEFDVQKQEVVAEESTRKYRRLHSPLQSTSLQSDEELFMLTKGKALELNGTVMVFSIKIVLLYSLDMAMCLLIRAVFRPMLRSFQVKLKEKHDLFQCSRFFIIPLYVRCILSKKFIPPCCIPI